MKDLQNYEQQSPIVTIFLKTMKEFCIVCGYTYLLMTQNNGSQSISEYFAKEFCDIKTVLIAILRVFSLWFHHEGTAEGSAGT